MIRQGRSVEGVQPARQPPLLNPKDVMHRLVLAGVAMLAAGCAASRSVPLDDLVDRPLPKYSVQVTTGDRRVDGLIVQATADSITIQSAGVGLDAGERVVLATSEIERIEEMSPTGSGMVGLVFVTVFGGLLIYTALGGSAST